MPPLHIDFSSVPAGTEFGVVENDIHDLGGATTNAIFYNYYTATGTASEDGTGEFALAPADFVGGSGNALHFQRIGMNILYGGGAATFSFDYLDRDPHSYSEPFLEYYNLTLGTDGITHAIHMPSFREIIEGPEAEDILSYLNIEEMLVSETALPGGDVYGHVSMVTNLEFVAFTLSGRDLWIDNLQITFLPEPSAAALLLLPALLLRRPPHARS